MILKLPPDHVHSEPLLNLRSDKVEKLVHFAMFTGPVSVSIFRRALLGYYVELCLFYCLLILFVLCLIVIVCSYSYLCVCLV